MDANVAPLEADDVIFTFKAATQEETNGNKGSGRKDYLGFSFSASVTTAVDQ